MTVKIISTPADYPVRKDRSLFIQQHFSQGLNKVTQSTYVEKKCCLDDYTTAIFIVKPK